MVELKYILDINRVVFAVVVIPTPSKCAHAACSILGSSYCCHIVLVSLMWWTYKHAFVVADVNIHTVIANNCSRVCVKREREWF